MLIDLIKGHKIGMGNPVSARKIPEGDRKCCKIFVIMGVMCVFGVVVGICRLG